MFDIVDSLAGGDVLKYEAILDLDLTTAIVTMIFKKDKAYSDKKQKEFEKQKTPKNE